MLAVAAIILLQPMILGQTKEVWKADFTFKVRAKGAKTKTKKWWVTWDVDREMKGTFTLERTFRGAGLARSLDNNNLERYECWVTDKRHPLQMRMNDKTVAYGPLVNPTDIRKDVTTAQCPIGGKPGEWQEGTSRSPVLQIDYQKGTYTFEFQRFYALARKQFRRDFVEGSARWTANKPLIQNEDDKECEIIAEPLMAGEWFRTSGPFKKGQSVIDMSRKYALEVKLAGLFPNEKVMADFQCVLQRMPASP